MVNKELEVRISQPNHLRCKRLLTDLLLCKYRMCGEKLVWFTRPIMVTQTGAINEQVIWCILSLIIRLDHSRLYRTVVSFGVQLCYLPLLLILPPCGIVH